MTNSFYSQTTSVYNKLGKKYLDDSKRIVPPKRLDFSNLFVKGQHILDVGCGGGRDAEFYSKILPDENKRPGVSWVTILVRK